MYNILRSIFSYPYVSYLTFFRMRLTFRLETFLYTFTRRWLMSHLLSMRMNHHENSPMTRLRRCFWWCQVWFIYMKCVLWIYMFHLHVIVCFHWCRQCWRGPFTAARSRNYRWHFSAGSCTGSCMIHGLYSYIYILFVFICFLETQIHGFYTTYIPVSYGHSFIRCPGSWCYRARSIMCVIGWWTSKRKWPGRTETLVWKLSCVDLHYNRMLPTTMLILGITIGHIFPM